MKKSPTKTDLKNRDDVKASIKERAYLIAESEGFPHGRDIIHWLQAEEEILARHMRELSGVVKNAVANAANHVKPTGANAVKIPVQAEPKAQGAKPSITKAERTAAKPHGGKPKSAAAKSTPQTVAPQNKKSGS